MGIVRENLVLKCPLIKKYPAVYQTFTTTERAGSVWRETLSGRYFQDCGMCDVICELASWQLFFITYTSFYQRANLCLHLDSIYWSYVFPQQFGCTVTKWPVEVTLRPVELLIHLNGSWGCFIWKKNLQKLNLPWQLKERLILLMFVLSYS